MKQRLILTVALSLLSAAISCHPQVVAVLGSPAWAGDPANPGASSRPDTLVDKARAAVAQAAK